MNWFPARSHDCKLILESQGDAKERFIIVPATHFNAMRAFIFSDLYQTCFNNDYIPIILPLITEQFTSKLCSLVWRLFENDDAIIEEFCQSQPAFRTKILKADIKKGYPDILDIGLYDAFQLIKISKRKVVFILDSVDALFKKSNYCLLMGLGYFLTSSPDSLLVGGGEANSNSYAKFSRIHGYKIHILEDIAISEFVSNSLRAAKLVSPHLNISYQDALEYYTSCQRPEEYISALQNMVLHQEQQFSIFNQQLIQNQSYILIGPCTLTRY